MIHFEWPWLLTALPLPLLVRWLLPANTPLEQSALKVPFLDDFSDGKTPLISKHQQWRRGFLQLGQMKYPLTIRKEC